MGGGGEHLARPRVLDGFRYLGQGPRRVHDVVHDEGRASLHLADHVVDLGHVGGLAPFVHDGQGGLQPLGVGPGPLHAARVGGDHGQPGQLEPGNVVHDHGGREEVIHGHVEEALDLGGVQVHGQDAVGAGGGDEVRHQLGGDGHPGFVLAVLTRVAVVGDHRRQAGGARALEGIEHDQELHQVLVHGGGGGLNHEDVRPPHVVLDLEPDLAVAEAREVGAAQGDPQRAGDALAQARVGASREYLQLLAHDIRSVDHALPVPLGPGHAAPRRGPGLAGAEGFEPSNTGSKAPRLTTWPRPSGSTALRLRGVPRRSLVRCP